MWVVKSIIESAEAGRLGKCWRGGFGCFFFSEEFWDTPG